MFNVQKVVAVAFDLRKGIISSAKALGKLQVLCTGSGLNHKLDAWKISNLPESQLASLIDHEIEPVLRQKNQAINDSLSDSLDDLYLQEEKHNHDEDGLAD